MRFDARSDARERDRGNWLRWMFVVQVRLYPKDTQRASVTTTRRRRWRRRSCRWYPVVHDRVYDDSALSACVCPWCAVVLIRPKYGWHPGFCVSYPHAFVCAGPHVRTWIRTQTGFRGSPPHRLPRFVSDVDSPTCVLACLPVHLPAYLRIHSPDFLDPESQFRSPVQCCQKKPRCCPALSSFSLWSNRSSRPRENPELFPRRLEIYYTID